MINWLNSYPKSGNTWIRIFLDAYLRDREPDINSLKCTISDQNLNDYKTSDFFSPNNLDLELQVLLRPAALMNILFRYGKITPYIIVKSHNANVVSNGIRLIPPQLSGRVVYVVRDPRDVALSFSRHLGKPVDETIESMMNEGSILHGEKGLAIQYTGSWVRHVESYLTNQDLEVMMFKYEDLLEDPQKEFSQILEWYKIPVDKKRVKKAINWTKFDKLKNQEKTKGFQEKSEFSNSFFRKGMSGSWESDLTETQKEKIVNFCGETMNKLDYRS